MARQLLPPGNYRFALLDFLLRRSIRGCRTVWAALWRFLKLCFASHLPHLCYSLASIPPSLYWRATGCPRRPSPSDDCVPCYGLVDPAEGVLSVQETKVVAGAVSPYIVCSEGYPSTGTSPISTIGPFTARIDEPTIAETQAIVMPSASLLRSMSRVSSYNDSGHCRSNDNVVHSTSNTSQISTSSETLTNIPLQPILVEPPSSSGSSHSDQRQSTRIPYTSGIISGLGTGSSWEISNCIWPMMPTQVPRYNNNRIM